MRILDVRHKGLKRLMEDDDRSDLPAQLGMTQENIGVSAGHDS